MLARRMGRFSNFYAKMQLMSFKEKEPTTKDLSFRQMLGLLGPNPVVTEEEESLATNESRELSFRQMLGLLRPETRKTK